MNRAWSGLAVASLLGVIAGCGADVHDVGTLEESTSAQTEALEGCQPYTTYTAALGDATIACLGTISPKAYAVDRSTGQLVRDFKECPAEVKDPNNPERDALRDIDDLLALQSPELKKELPLIGQCMANGWNEWRKQFLAAGNNTCPTFRKVESFGVAAYQPEDTKHYVDIEKYIATLPVLPKDEKVEVKEPPAIGKSYAYYEVEFPDGRNPNGGCKNALDCANQCGSAFAGYVGEQQHEKYFVGDPTWWVADEYPPGANPYLAPGYYHPMSFLAPLPGAIYGHRARVGEACSKWAGGITHYVVGLVEWCANPFLKIGCMSKCSGAAVNVYDGAAY